MVCDRLTIRIHTQFNGHPSEVHTVLLQELDQPEKQTLLRRIWLNPESFRPKKTSRDITEAAAKSFALLAEGLRKRGAGTPEHADEVAHFLTQCLFCFFAEDVGLLPGRMFEGLVNNKALTSDKLATGLNNLFTVMRDGGLYGNDDIPWFNGGLFKKIRVPTVTIMDMTELRNAAALNWSAIDVSIFGTLFERGLDPSKRSQLGAHYTDPATIMRIVEPVLSRPLLQKWELVTQEIRGLVAKSIRKNDKHYNLAKARFVLWLEDLKAYRVLDPACGSGNFLFLGLKAPKDIEHRSHLDAAALGLDREADLVTGPHNVLGIELNEYAAELARVTVWIGELQWRMAHGYDFKTNPVLEPLDHIECRDALLSFSDSGVRVGATPGLTEPSVRNRPQHLPLPHPCAIWAWVRRKRGQIRIQDSSLAGGKKRRTKFGSDPGFRCCRRKTRHGSAVAQSQCVIGNPPFLGDKKNALRLGDDYTHWILNFRTLTEADASLYERPFEFAKLHIYPIRCEEPHPENHSVWWQFERSRPEMFAAFGSQPRYIATCLVAKHRFFVWQHRQVVPENVVIVVARADDTTFGILHSRLHELWALRMGTSPEDRPRYTPTTCFETFPFPAGLTPAYTAHQRTETLEGGAVIPADISVTNRPPALVNSARAATKTVAIDTPSTADQTAGAGRRTGAISKSAAYEPPASAPPPPGQRGEAPTGDVRANAIAIAQAAKELNKLREEWLNPDVWTHKVKEVTPLGMDHSPYPDRIEPKPGISEEDLKALQKRTLTNLYNLRPSWLAMAHAQLDQAVAAAYGWTDYTADMPDEEILKRLLALNLARSQATR